MIQTHFINVKMFWISSIIDIMFFFSFLFSLVLICWVFVFSFFFYFLFCRFFWYIYFFDICIWCKKCNNELLSANRAKQLKLNREMLGLTLGRDNEFARLLQWCAETCVGITIRGSKLREWNGERIKSLLAWARKFYLSIIDYCIHQ